MIVRYTLCPVRSPVPALGGAKIMPRPLLPVQITGPSGSRLRDGLLDTGADETILDPSVAGQIGVDLTWHTGFAPFPVLRGLLGFAGFLQFFDAGFHGADQETVLVPNRLFSGRRI
jgi:hypothetical protein